jgi:hypothetical protein
MRRRRVMTATATVETTVSSPSSQPCGTRRASRPAARYSGEVHRPLRVSLACPIRTMHGSSRLVVAAGRDHRPCAHVRLGSITAADAGEDLLSTRVIAGAEMNMRTLAALSFSAFIP